MSIHKFRSEKLMPFRFVCTFTRSLARLYRSAVAVGVTFLHSLERENSRWYTGGTVANRHCHRCCFCCWCACCDCCCYWSIYRVSQHCCTVYNCSIAERSPRHSSQFLRLIILICLVVNDSHCLTFISNSSESENKQLIRLQLTHRTRRLLIPNSYLSFIESIFV